MNTSSPFNRSSLSKDNMQTPSSYSASNFLTVAGFGIISIIELLLLYGIIFYEKYGRFRYRTIINQLFSSVCCTTGWLILLTYIGESTRLIIGPLNETLCHFHMMLTVFLVDYLLLTFDAITILRHIFIFNMPNFAFIDDNFLARCFLLSIAMASSWSTCVLRMSPGASPFVDYVCAGIDPNENERDSYHIDGPAKTPITGLIIIVSIILHLMINTKIFLYQRKEEQTEESVELGTFDNQPNAKHNKPQQTVQGKLFNKSMVDLSTQILFLIYIILFGVLAIIKPNHKMGLSIIEEEVKYWYLYFSKMATIHSFVLTFVSIYYCRSEPLRDFLKRRITAALQRNNT